MPIDELAKKRLITVIKGAQEEAPDFGMSFGMEHFTADEMVEQVRLETEVGLSLLSLLGEVERDKERKNQPKPGLIRRVVGKLVSSISNE